MSERFKDARETIVSLAKESFRDHVITATGSNEWQCGRPGSSAYYFNVIARPGYLIIFGDIGDWILQHNDRDCVGWLRRAARDYEYLCGKIRAGEKKRFYQGDAEAWLRERIAAGDEDAGEVAEALRGEDFDEHRWYEAWSDAGTSGVDIYDARNYDSGPLWMAEAVKWFAAHLPAQETAGAAEGASL